MKFKIGDKVKVITKRYPFDSLGNQYGRIGTVKEFGGLGIAVNFNGYTNSYYNDDLKLLNSELIKEKLGIK